MRGRILCGLALVAFAALGPGAVAAGAAAFSAEKYPATVGGKQSGVTKTGEGTIIGFEGGLMTECGTAGFGTELTEASSSLTVESTVFSCEMFGLPATVANNGCEYVLHAGSGSGDSFTGTMDITCPAGNSIVITGSTCEILIGTQKGLGPVLYENLTEAAPKPQVQANFEIAGEGGFTYTKAKDGVFCPLSGTGVKTGGVFVGGVTMDANSSGAVGLSVK